MSLEPGMLVRYKPVANLPWLPEFGIGIVIEVKDEFCVVCWQNNIIFKEWTNDLERCEE